MTHPRCVGWGEIGLDYHYDNSPRDVQRAVFVRQLRQAVNLGKPLTIHTREAEEDTERILKSEVPNDHKVIPEMNCVEAELMDDVQIHVHCFTDSPGFAQRLLDHFPNLHIGITGTSITLFTSTH
jgi:TatD DNase family protein